MSDSKSPDSNRGGNSGAPQRSQASSGEMKPKGQKVSSERGTATNHKKNPGKRAHQGGGSR
ncbi:MAG: hypothetical protein AB1430_11085 [Pseudomonadota bacterium]